MTKKKNGKSLPSNVQLLVDQYPDVAFLTADGFDGAIIGVEEIDMRVIYSVKRCIEILIQDEEMSEEDALEHFSYNVAGSYVGEKTPIWCYDSMFN